MLVVIIPVMRLNIQSSLEPISSKGLVAAPNIYRPRVTVLQDGVPNDDAKVWCSAGGEPKKVAGGWQFDIPREGLPSDGEVVFYAEKSSAFRRGQVRLKLLLTAAPTVEINLERDRSAGISGIVQDAIGRALVGVAVNTLGASYTTDERGRFRFRAQWGDGERVVVHAEAPGYKPVDQGHQAGNDVMVIVLDLEKP